MFLTTLSHPLLYWLLAVVWCLNCMKIPLLFLAAVATEMAKSSVWVQFWNPEFVELHFWNGSLTKAPEDDDNAWYWRQLFTRVFVSSMILYFQFTDLSCCCCSCYLYPCWVHFFKKNWINIGLNVKIASFWKMSWQQWLADESVCIKVGFISTENRLFYSFAVRYSYHVTLVQVVYDNFREPLDSLVLSWVDGGWVLFIIFEFLQFTFVYTSKVIH